MKILLRHCLIAAALAAGDFALTAQEPGQPRTAGRVLVLASDRCLEGDIEKIGDQYRIRRGQSEVWLPADKGICLYANWEEVYMHMKNRANLGDPDERLRLARWCKLNNLTDQALAEAKQALEMRPNHQESRQLVTMLTRAHAAATEMPAKKPAAQPRPVLVAASAEDISADSYALFASRVQPILMNTCVTCHSGGRGGSFQLLRVEGSARSSTQANLAAAIAQVDVQHPSLSPLLIKAVCRHGNAAKAPLKDRQSMPFVSLQGWVAHLLANNPHLKYQNSDTAAATSKSEPEVFAQTQLPPKTRPRITAAKSTAPVEETVNPAISTQAQAFASMKTVVPTRGAATSNSPPTASADETQSVNSLDPFDPAIFNHQFPRQTKN